MSNYYISVEPASEPITTAEAKAQLRVDFSDEDTYIDTLIASARKYCEAYCNRVFITQTWVQLEDKFTSPIELRVNPVISLTSLKYYDTNESQQTITDDTDNFQKRFNRDVAKIYEGVVNDFPNVSTSWVEPIEITYVCGYGSASDVPDDIKHAIKLMVAHLYENRDMVSRPIASMPFNVPMPDAVKHLLDRYRVRHFG
jgi:uncharacterized phiE125 gp8 family phage protein